MVSEFQNRFKERLAEVEPLFKLTDPYIKFIKEDHIGEYQFQSGLRMLPVEFLEKYGYGILQDENEYKKYSSPKYDVYRMLWEENVEGYWKDKLQFLEQYVTPVTDNETPREINNGFIDRMIKIEKRSLLLKPEPKLVEQKHTRVSGQEKDYLFVRTYWIDKDGFKKRMISRHIGEKFENIQKEVMDLFHNLGYGVIRDYKSGNGKIYDVVIQRGDMKTVIEIKMVNKDIFTNLFIFDELLKKFEEEYPKG